MKFKKFASLLVQLKVIDFNFVIIKLYWLIFEKKNGILSLLCITSILCYKMTHVPNTCKLIVPTNFSKSFSKIYVNFFFCILKNGAKKKVSVFANALKKIRVLHYMDVF